MLFVRYWANFHELTGSFFIKNYALILLVLTFLAKKKIVPTILQLQELHDQKGDPNCIIDGWNAGFCTDLNKIRQYDLPGKPPVREVSWASMLDLIYGFFQMFAELDFENNVICPLIGSTLPRDHFQPGHEESLPESMERYKVWSANQDLESRFRISAAFKIQDPFQLSFNVGSITPAHTLFTFRIGCVHMIETFHDFQTKKRTPTLLDFFVKLPKYVTERKSFSYQLAAKQRLWLAQEVNLALGEDDEEEFDPAIFTQVVEPQPESDSDLWLLRKLVELGKSTSGRKNGTLQFEIERPFYQTCVKHLTRLEPGMELEQMNNHVKLLWGQFVLDYLAELWGKVFQMGVEKKSEWTTPAPPPSEELRSQPRKSMAKLAAELNSSSASGSGEEGANEFNREDILKGLEELVKDQQTPEQVFYFKICSRVCKPFFTRRSAVCKKLLKAVQGEDEVGSSEGCAGNPQPPRATKKKKMFDMLLHINPLDFERRVTEAVLEESTKVALLPLKLSCYGKLDLKLDEDEPSPEFQLVFKKLESGSSVEAFECLVKTIKETFAKYLLHRVVNFFKLTADETESSGKTFTDIDFDMDEELKTDDEEDEEEIMKELQAVSDAEAGIGVSETED
jgi:hypothetical protein